MVYAATLFGLACKLRPNSYAQWLGQLRGQFVTRVGAPCEERVLRSQRTKPVDPSWLIGRCLVHVHRSRRSRRGRCSCQQRARQRAEQLAMQLSRLQGRLMFRTAVCILDDVDYVQTATVRPTPASKTVHRPRLRVRLQTRRLVVVERASHPPATVRLPTVVREDSR